MRRRRRSDAGVWVELRLDANGHPFILFEPRVTPAQEQFAARWLQAAHRDQQQQLQNQPPVQVVLKPGRHFTDEQINEIGRELDKRTTRSTGHHPV